MEGIIKLFGSLMEGMAMFFNRKHASKTYQDRTKNKQK